MVLVIESGHPNGTDLVMGEPAYQQHTGIVDAVVDGLPVRIFLRLVSLEGKLYALRQVVVLHPGGERLRRLDHSKYVDDVESARG